MKITENWKNVGRVFVARDNKGRLISWRKQKGSRLTVSQAKEIYRETGSFFTTKFKGSQALTNLSENYKAVSTSIEQKDKAPRLKEPSGIVVQYYVEGYYGKSYIVARSNKMYSPGINTATKAKQQAWNSFLAILGWYATGKQVTAKGVKLNYDADEGINYIEEVTRLKEGWVYYKPLKRK